MAKLSKVLGQIKPRPKIIEIGGEPFEFHQLTLADFVEIEEKTGVDLTKEMLRARGGNNPEEVFSSKLINYIIYLSLKRGDSDLAKEMTLGAAAELVSYGMSGEQLGGVLIWAISGVTPDDEAGGGSGNTRLRESTGGSQSPPSSATTG